MPECAGHAARRLSAVELALRRFHRGRAPADQWSTVPIQRPHSLGSACLHVGCSALPPQRLHGGCDAEEYTSRVPAVRAAHWPSAGRHRAGRAGRVEPRRLRTVVGRAALVERYPTGGATAGAGLRRATLRAGEGGHSTRRLRRSGGSSRHLPPTRLQGASGGRF